MNAVLKKSSRTDDDRSLSPDIAERLGDRRLSLIKQWVAEVNGPFDALIARHVTEASSVLDAGSGRGDPDLPSVNAGRTAVACDPDVSGLQANRCVRLRTAALLEALPFANNSFDVVVCKFVIEHLRTPLETFKEFYRVLRPGGVLALLTPNKYSVFVLVSSLMPTEVKQRLKRNLFGGHDDDTFPTFYHANTIGALDRALTAAGFNANHVERLAGMWAFFIFSSPIARCVRTLERVNLRIPGLRVTATHLMGVWQKPALQGAAA